MKSRDLVFFAGRAFEPWSPETVADGGNGGSEVALVELTKRLAEAGHRVTVYADTPHHRDYDGVVWMPYLNLLASGEPSCDVLVLYRRPFVLPMSVSSHAKTLLWMQDAHVGTELTPAIASAIDRIIAVSGWHAGFLQQTYPFLEPGKVIASRNGIDPRRFEAEFARAPHRAIYSSAPERGLDVALRLWPRVRERVPDATLHVFYGFNTLEHRVRGTEGEAEVAALRARLAHAYSYGVVERGRLGQAELAREYLRASVWAYPTHFWETSCIAAIEAQAAGLRIVTTPLAALWETVGPRGALVFGEGEAYEQQWVQIVVAALLEPEIPDERAALKRFAAGYFSWDLVAHQWLDLLEELLESKPAR